MDFETYVQLQLYCSVMIEEEELHLELSGDLCDENEKSAFPLCCVVISL